MTTLRFFRAITTQGIESHDKGLSGATDSVTDEAVASENRQTGSPTGVPAEDGRRYNAASFARIDDASPRSKNGAPNLPTNDGVSGVAAVDVVDVREDQEEEGKETEDGLAGDRGAGSPVSAQQLWQSEGSGTELDTTGSSLSPDGGGKGLGGDDGISRDRNEAGKADKPSVGAMERNFGAARTGYRLKGIVVSYTFFFVPYGFLHVFHETSSGA